MRFARLFWASVIPIALVSKWIVERLAPVLAPRAVDPQEIQQAFLSGLAGACAPEPLELTTYALAVLVPALLMLIVGLVLNQLGAFRREEWQSPWLDAAAIASQICLVSYAGSSWLYENAHSWAGQLNNFARAQLVIGGCVAGYIGWCWLRPEPKRLLVASWQRLSTAHWLAWLIAIGWSVSHLLGCVFTDENIGRASGTISYHLPFVMGEFAAVLNGRFPLVDFYPQYENLLGHLLHPYFAVAGLTVTTFTVGMSLLSLVGFLLIFRVLWRVTDSPWLALVLYVPWVAISLAEAETPGINPSNAFNYYAVGPVRYWGVFLLAYLSMSYLMAPRVGRLAQVSFFAGLVGLNNLDFGATSAVGLLTCAVLFPPSSGSAGRIWRILHALAIFFGGVASALVAFSLVARVAYGVWPSVSALTQYQRTFAYLGFNMVAMPTDGLYWIIYLTYMVALVYVVFEAVSGDPRSVSRSRRLSLGMLAFGSVSGFGVSVYFVGRSHPGVIIAMYSSWAFVVALLLHRVLCDVQEKKRSHAVDGDIIDAIPVTAMLALCCGLLPIVLEVPNVSYEVQRLRQSGPVDTRPARLAKLVAKYVKKNQPTVVSYVNAHQIAQMAAVSNLFPFAHTGSVLLSSQIQPVLKSIERLPAGDQYVFGAFWPPVAAALNRWGFVPVESDGDFGVWHTVKPGL